MKKPPALEELCALLAERPPNWEYLAKRLNARFRHHSSPGYLDYSKYLSEKHMDYCLSDTAEQHPELDIRTRPVKNKSRSYSHNSSYTREGRLFTYCRANWKRCREYDKVITVGKLPVIVEVKIAVWSSLRKALSQQRIEEEIVPISELFGCDVGYFFIVPNDSYDRATSSNSSNYSHFMQKGGLFVPLYATQDQWRKDVEAVIAQEHLNDDLRLPITAV